MQETRALNIKIPRLGKNRLGVFFVRSSYADDHGKLCVTQLSLRTKDPGLAKLLGLKFCIHLAQGGNLSDFKHGVSAYIVDIGNGRFEANGEDDHRRAMEAHRLALLMLEKKLEAQRLALQIALRQAPELDAAKHRQMQNNPVGLDVANAMAELFPSRNVSQAVLPSGQFNDVAGLKASSSESSGDESTTGDAFTMSKLDAPRQPTRHLFPSLQRVSARPALRLQDEMNRHLEEEARSGIKPQTINEKRAVFEDFLSCFGEATALNDITRDEVTHRWRAEEFNRKNRKDIEKQSKCKAEGDARKVEVKTLSPGRIEKRRGYLAKFFTWAIDGGTYKHQTPMSQKMYTKQQIENATTSYREFSNEDITALFATAYPIEMNRPDWYWVPLVSLYSGARLGEVCNLQVATFAIIDDIKVFQIDESKTNASKRIVPIHSKLLELGLWEYAQELKARRYAHFLPHAPNDYRSKSVGRMWGKWVAKCGITDENKTFHSFRSTAITDMHNADEAHAGHAAIQRSVGHATSGTSGSHGKYVRGIKLRNLQSAIESVTHDNFDVSHLLVSDPTFTVFFDKHFAFANRPGEIERKQQRENHLKAKAQRLTIAEKSDVQSQ